MKSSVTALSLRKKGERNFYLPGKSATSLEYGRDVGCVVGFVRFTKVALAAELGRRGRVGVGHVVDVRVVGAVHEEEGGVELAAAISRDRALCRGGVHGHNVLVV